MKGVDTIARVRREPFVRGKTIKEIVRDLHISRNTVRKILRSGATAFDDERTVQPQPRLGPWRAELERLLAANAVRSSRERLTLMRIFEELRGLGDAGGGACPPAPPAATGGDAVRRFAVSWRRGENAATASAFVPLSFAPGEAYQFDWSHEIVVIDGVTTTVKGRRMRRPHAALPQPDAVRAGVPTREPGATHALRVFDAPLAGAGRPPTPAQ